MNPFELYKWYFKPRIIERNGKFAVAKYRGWFTNVYHTYTYFVPSNEWIKTDEYLFDECFYDIGTAKRVLDYVNRNRKWKDCEDNQDSLK
jgi:hypothetical protein